MDYAKEQAVVTEKPDFVCLLEAITTEANNVDELSQLFGFLVSNIKPINEKKDSNDTLCTEPIGVVEHLWKQIRIIQDKNNRLYQIANHLQKIVGN
jgi:uncharacterized membrane protein